MDCLVTKLKGTVNDNTLTKLGEFRLKITTVGAMGIKLPNNFRILSGKACLSKTVEMTDKVSSIDVAQRTEDNFIDTEGVEETIIIDDKYHAVDGSDLSFWSGNSTRSHVSMDAENYLTYLDNKDVVVEITIPRNLGIDNIPISAFKGFVNAAMPFHLMTGSQEEFMDLIKSIKEEDGVAINVDTNLNGWYLDLADFNDVKCKYLSIKGTSDPNYMETEIRNIDSLANPNIITFSASQNDSVTKIADVKRMFDQNPKLTYLDLWDKISEADTFMDALAAKSLDMLNVSGTFTYSDQLFTGKTYSAVLGKSLTINNLDGFLNAFSQASFKDITGVDNKHLTITGGSRTTASDAAIFTLQSKGVTVSVPVATDAIHTMAVKDNGNWAVDCKDGKALARVPVDLTKMVIVPASGVTVKTFDTKENAEKFIEDNRFV